MSNFIIISFLFLLTGTVYPQNEGIELNLSKEQSGTFAVEKVIKDRMIVIPVMNDFNQTYDIEKIIKFTADYEVAGDGGVNVIFNTVSSDTTVNNEQFGKNPDEKLVGQQVIFRKGRFDAGEKRLPRNLSMLLMQVSGYEGTNLFEELYKSRTIKTGDTFPAKSVENVLIRNASMDLMMNMAMGKITPEKLSGQLVYRVSDVTERQIIIELIGRPEFKLDVQKRAGDFGGDFTLSANYSIVIDRELNAIVEDYGWFVLRGTLKSDTQNLEVRKSVGMEAYYDHKQTLTDNAPKVGNEAPDISLYKLGHQDEEAHVKLADFKGKKDVVLVFGSYT